MELQELLKGKILVGHDLQMEFKYLAINANQLMGVRDLAAALVFKHADIQTKGNGQFYKLQTLAKQIVDLDIQKGIHSALQDAKAVRLIYKKIENKWIDHHAPPKPQEYYKRKITLQDYQQRKMRKIDAEQPGWSRETETLIDIRDDDEDEVTVEQNVNEQDVLHWVDIDDMDDIFEIGTEQVTAIANEIMNETNDNLESLIQQEIQDPQQESKTAALRPSMSIMGFCDRIQNVYDNHTLKEEEEEMIIREITIRMERKKDKKKIEMTYNL